MFVKRSISHIFSIVFVIIFLTTGVLPAQAEPLQTSGDFVWAKGMGSASEDFASAMTLDSNGNIYTAGSFENTVDFDTGPGTFTLTSAGGFDIYVSKFDSSGNLIWAKSMGGTSAEGGFGIAVDAGGNVYTSGNITGVADLDPGADTFTLTNAGSFDVFVSKLDGNGDFVWAKSMGGLNDDTNSGIGLDSSGNVYVTGSFQGTADFDPGTGTTNLASAGVDDIFVSKLDNNGDFIWARSMGGTTSDWPQSMTVDPNGNVYTTGYFTGVTGTADFDPGPDVFTLVSAASNDVFVSKLDGNGNFVWAKGMGGPAIDISLGITTDASSNVYTTGYFTNTADFDPGPDTFNLTSTGSRDVFVSKLDDNGDFVWANKMGGPGVDRGFNIAVDSGGYVYSSGTFVDSADFDPDPINTFNLVSTGLDDIFISKVDGNGDFIWTKSIGGSGGDHISSISVDSNSNIYTTGWFRGTADFDPDPANTFNLTSAGFDDIFLSKLEGNTVEATVTPTATLTLQNTFTPTPTIQTGTGTTIRVSLDGNNNQANGGNYKNEISDNGQIVAFQSLATNLVSNDTNGFSDIFIRDRLTDQTERVNVSSSGDQANNYVADLSMSANGQFIAFWSDATNLVSSDTNGTTDVFVHDRQTGQTERVSVDSNGNQSNSFSNEFSLSADGRFVSFVSHASNLVSGDTNGKDDIFVHDRQTGQTELVSVNDSGNQANNHSDFSAISADGQFVVFRSTATNLVSGDTNGFADIFIHDRQTGQTQRINVDGSGNQANAAGSNETDGGRAELAVSADGRFIAFESLATNLVSNDTNGVADIFIRDRQTGQTERVSIDNNGNQANGLSAELSMSDDGRFIAFRSDASNLVSDDNNATSDIFVHDRQTGQTERVSLDVNDNEANSYSFWPSISADGQFISFGSFASNLVLNDTNNTADVFVRERPSFENTPTPTATQTYTSTPVDTLTFTPTETHTPSPIPTETFTSTPTETHTPSPTPTHTATPTYTFTPTETPTFTATPDLSLSLLAPVHGEQLLYNRPTFDWTDVPDAVSYTIQISNNIGFTSPTSNTVTESTYTQPTNLTANATRYWRVQANTILGTGSWSEIRNFKTANPPGAAGLIAPANNGLVTDYTPLLDWNNSTVPVVTTFLKYELQIATDNAFTSPTIIDISGPVTDSSYTPATELDPNTTYYWRVRAYNTLGHYSIWSTRSFRTAHLPPVLNTPNDAEQLLNNRPTFDWEDVPGVTGYSIQISDVNDFATNLVSAVVTQSTYVRTTDLPANTTLYWRVQSRGTNGPSAWSDVRILTTANPPSVPTLTSPANNAEVSGSSLLFNWDDAMLPFGIVFDHYQIQVATSNTFTTIVHDQVVSGIFNSQDNSALLLPSTTYYWRVRSFNVDGHSSAWSAVRSVRIKFSGPLINLPANGSTTGSLIPTFTWEAESGAINYTIQVSKNSSFSPVVINTISSMNSYTHGTNLQAGTTYYWRVRVNTPAAYGPGDWSQVYSFTTP